MEGDQLGSLLDANTNAKRPAPIYHGILSDIFCVKKLVEEAISLAIRASNQQSVTGRGNISRERQHRMCQLAVSKLTKAYAINEVAASVATMQSASALEDVAVKILKKDSGDLDALYVHHFHELIPSRQLAESTSIESLDLMIRSCPLEPHLLRSRASILTFKDEHSAAVKDLTSALNLLEYNKAHHQGGSLESQLVFMRGEGYLTLAVNSVVAALDSEKEEHRKKIRLYARRSIRDLLKFCSFLEYTRNLRHGPICPLSSLFEASAKPTKLAIEAPPDDSKKPTKEEIIRRVAIARAKRNMEQNGSMDGPQCPTDLSKTLSNIQDDQDRAALTYHPLLPDCLHSLLLSHVLACTPPAEIKRHAEQVLHLSKTCDGFPVFLNPRSSARSDWIELLRRRGRELIGSTDWSDTAAVLAKSNAEKSDGSAGGGGGGGSNLDAVGYPVSDRAGIIADWVAQVYLTRLSKAKQCSLTPEVPGITSSHGTTTANTANTATATERSEELDGGKRGHIESMNGSQHSQSTNHKSDTSVNHGNGKDATGDGIGSGDGVEGLVNGVDVMSFTSTVS